MLTAPAEGKAVFNLHLWNVDGTDKALPCLFLKAGVWEIIMQLCKSNNSSTNNTESSAQYQSEMDLQVCCGALWIAQVLHTCYSVL